MFNKFRMSRVGQVIFIAYLSFVLGTYSEKFSGSAVAWIGLVFVICALAVLLGVHISWVWKSEDEQRRQ